MRYAEAAASRIKLGIKTKKFSDSDLEHPLLQIGPFVPVPKGYLSRFWNRDSAAGTKALEAFVTFGTVLAS